jgi:hypothetical protein
MTRIPARVRLRLNAISLVVTMIFAFAFVVIETHLDVLVYGYLGSIFTIHGIEVYGAKRN